jgi:hypothetical protein
MTAGIGIQRVRELLDAGAQLLEVLPRKGRSTSL